MWLIFSVLLSCEEAIPNQVQEAEEEPVVVSVDPIFETIIQTALQSDRAMDKLVELCDDIGPRLSGSANLDKAISWAEQTMKKEGLVQVRQQKVMVPHWERGEERLELLAPRKEDLSMLGLGMSVGTDGRWVEGELVVVSSFDELDALGPEKIKGKIVLYNVPFTTYGETVQYRSGGAERASAHGAKAVLVRSVSPVSLSTPHTGTMRYGDSPPIPAAAITLEDAERFARWQSRGQKSTVRLQMDAKMFPEASSANVIAEVKGSERPDEIVVIGGHMDSWDVGQGAQDDGAGVVISMEAARILASLPMAPKRTIRVVLFTNEENGLRGGKAYAASVSPSERHVAAIEADIGAGIPQWFSYKVPETMLDSEMKKWKVQLAGAQAAVQRLGMKEMEPGYAGADIGPLVKLGVLGFGLRMDTSTYWPVHHTHADTIDKIDPELLRKNTAAMAVWAWALANAEL